MMRPSQALVWNSFNLSWPALLIQFAGVVTAVFIIDLAIDPGIDPQALFRATEMVFIISLTFLYIAALNRRQSRGPGSSSLGFPYRREFSHPVTTSTLTFVPLFFFCALTQVALFVPGTIVNLLFLDMEISLLPISFTLFQFTIFPLMLAWWTQNGLAALLGWLVTFILYLYGFLIPEFTRVENTWLVEAVPAASYILPLLSTSAMLVVTYLGVKQQRSGEDLMQLDKVSSNQHGSTALRDRIPIPIASCPTESPLKAEIWKERQLNGEYRAVFGGLVGACTTLVILSILDFFVPGESTVQFTSVMAMTLSVYFAVCIDLTVSMFGAQYKKGVANIGVHTRTTPMSTTQLTFVRTSVSLLSTLIAGCVTAAIVWIFGSFLIEDFQEIRVDFLEFVAFLLEGGFADGMLRVLLMLLAFLTSLVLLSIFFTWTMLHSRRMAIACALIAVYLFLIANGLPAFFRENEAYNLMVVTVIKIHLWIVILLIPLATISMIRGLLVDGVINKALLSSMLTIGFIFQGLNLLWLYGANNTLPINMTGFSYLAMTGFSYLAMQGFLPLLAVVFALWTTHKSRHG